mgnify:CR=1 FL=1
MSLNLNYQPEVLVSTEGLTEEEVAELSAARESADRMRLLLWGSHRSVPRGICIMISWESNRFWKRKNPTG